MFNFFKKKKTETVITKPSTETTSVKKDNLDGGQLEIEYKAVIDHLRADVEYLKKKTAEYLAKKDYIVKKEWIEALAICEVALSNKNVDDRIKELYKDLFSFRWESYNSMYYNDKDYNFWFHKCSDIHNAFITEGVSRAYLEQASLYGDTRKGYKNIDKQIEFYEKGVDNESPEAIGGYGFSLYFGFGNLQKADRRLGREYIERSLELGWKEAPTLLLYIEEDKNTPEFLDRVLKIIEEEEDSRLKLYNLLGDYYMNIGDIEKAREALRKGVEGGMLLCKHYLGMKLLFADQKNIDKEEYVKMLEEAYAYGIIEAAWGLGSYYRTLEDDSFLQKAIIWLERAELYCNTKAYRELACIYLYEEDYKNVEKGLTYLDEGIACGSNDAMVEKAYCMLETDILPRDIAGAKALLEQALDAGSKYASYRLAIGYQNAEFCEQPDYVKALELLEEGARLKDLYCTELAGNYYRVGAGGDSDEAQQKAVDYLTEAVKMGSSYARVELGLCYERGYGVEQNYQKAFDLFEEAANNNYPYANVKMAIYYERGVLGEPDYAKAFELYSIAADAGLPDAIYDKGRYYKYGVGIPENPAEALKLFREAAEKGSAPAYTELALAYEQEYGGTEFDANKVMEYMTQAAELGYPYAQHKMGIYYQYGLLETDFEKAKEWFTKAYNEGYPYSALSLGDFHLYNIENKEERDYEKAFEYYKFAEEQGVLSEGIGICYEFGFGVEKNETEAFKYFNLAANEGNIASKYRLALAYKYGTGTSVNMEEAYRWFSEAAEDNHFNALYETAILLLNGEGVAKDEVKAVEILTGIAEDNHDGAQFELGNCYLVGRGVPEDEVQAMFWYQKAADNGNEDAQKLTGKRQRRKR